MIKNKRINFVLERSGFEVRGEKGIPYTVTLFPTRTCTCAANIICYHILATQMALRISNTMTKKLGNTALFRRTIRRQREKASGRKKPRSGDIHQKNPIDFDPDDGYYDAFQSEPELTVTKQDTNKKCYVNKKKSEEINKEKAIESESEKDMIPTVKLIESANIL